MRVMHKQITQFFSAASLVVVFLSFHNTWAGHNTSRYFRYLERPEETLQTSRWFVSTQAFFTTASTAFSDEGGNTGIPELWGKYDLRDIINSIETVRNTCGPEFTNPFLLTPGVEGLAGHSVIFDVDGKVRSGGLFFHGAYQLWKQFYIGANFGIARVETKCRYHLNQGTDEIFDTCDPLVRDLLPSEVAQVERVRLAVNRELGIRQSDSDKIDFTDIDLYVRWNKIWDHALMMRTINLNILGGVLFPSGHRTPINNPCAVPHHSNGHWGFYLDGNTELELKPNWHIGVILSFMFQLSDTRCRRIPVLFEPATYSALLGDLRVNPGTTFKVSPYASLKNIVDGLHLNGRYTYLRHDADTWTDERTICCVPSFLTQRPSEDLTEGDIFTAQAQQLRRTRWRAHYFTLGLSYEPKEAQMKWPLDPVFFINYDIPLGGSSIMKTHHIHIGVDLRF